MKKLLPRLLIAALVLLLLPLGSLTIPTQAATEGYYTYTVSGGKATIIDYRTSISGSVTLPSTLGGYPVTSIGEDVFYGRTGLTSVTIPEGVTSIGASAFENCTGLTSVTIPEGVTSIGDDAFRGCTSLTSVTIPGSVTSIGSYAFYGCTNLVYKIYNGLKYLGSKANPYYALITDAEERSSYTLHENTKVIAVSAFRGCTGLTSVTIPEGVTSIGDDAFYGCTGLTSVTIQEGVTSIGGSAFAKCTSLTNVTIPGSVTSIGSSVFSGCTGLTNVTIPDSVTSIGSSAFFGCTGLTNVTIPNSVTSIGGSAFSGCTGLTSVTIPDSVTSIGNNAFYNCYRLTSVTIQEGVTSIGEYAFANCSKLISVTIPGSVTSIGNYAFKDCDSLTGVTISDGVSSIGNYAFEDCDSLTSVAIPGSVSSVGSYAFSDCDSLTDVTISDGAPSIGYYAFYNCDSLTSVAIPGSVSSIDTGAFCGCDSLTSVTISDGVTSIGGSAFQSCASLTSVTIPNSVTSIGWGTFGDCTSLRDVWYQGSSADRKNIAINSHGSNYLKNATWHYNTCVEHTYGGVCVSACNKCEYTREAEPHFVEGVAYSITNSSPYPFKLTNGWYISTNKTNSSSATFTLTAKDSGEISVWYQVSSEQTFDKLTIKKNSTTLVTASGTISETELKVALQEGDTLTFTYSKDGTVSKGTDTASFKIVTSPRVNAEDLEPDCVNSVICSGCGLVVKPATGHQYVNDRCTVCNALDPEVRFYTYTVSEGKATITDCSTSISGAITLPSTLGGYPVTGIGYLAFNNCDGLTSVTIPDSVTSIGNQAFSYCNNLTSVTIPGSVTGMGDNAFKDCDGLTSVTFLDGVTRIGNYAFTYCDGLTSVTIPGSVTSIGDYAFKDCTSLTGIWVSENNPSYQNDNFGVLFSKDGTLLIQAPGKLEGSYTIPEGVISIGAAAFRSCTGLTGVTIPDSVTSIGDAAFASCSSLTSVTMPNSVTSIGNYAFNGCTGLTGVTIPDSVTSMGTHVFYNCSSLTSVTIPGSVTGIGASMFSGCTRLTRATIPDSVTSIGNYAFYNCTSLTSVTIPGSVTGIGIDAFNSCTGLTSVTLLDGVSSIGNYAFYNCTRLTSVTIPGSVTSIGNAAFRGCYNLTSVSIPEGVTSIESELFRGCEYLTSVTIPESVTSIGGFAFYFCTRLTEVNIPEGVTAIGQSAFEYCTKLTNVTLPYGLTDLGISAFANCSSLNSITFEGSAPSIGSDCFSGVTATAYYSAGNQTWTENKLANYGGVITWRSHVWVNGVCADCGVACNHSYTSEITTNPGCTTDGVKTYTCPKCTHVYTETIPATGHNYVNDKCTVCDGLDPEVSFYLYTVVEGEAIITDCDTSVSGEITIPATLGGYPVTAIGEYAFSKCTGLTAVTIHDGVTAIGSYAFSGCTGLTAVTISGSVTGIGDGVFNQCTGLTTVTIPGSVTDIGYAAFYNCTGLTAVTIPGSVTAIGSYAFYNCTGLTSIVFEGSAPAFESACFGNVTATACYPCQDPTWTKEKLAGYGGKITWKMDPDRITGVTVSDVTDNAFTVTWEPLADNATYWIYLNGSPYCSTQGTSKTITSRTADTAYEIKVIASLANGSFQSLADATAVSVQTKPVPKVLGVNVAEITDNAFVVSWDAYEGASKYWVYINGYLYSGTEATSRTITNRNANTTYEVKVIASMADGSFQSLAGATAVSVQTKPLSKVSGVTASDVTDSSFVLTWDAYEGASKYWVYLNGYLYSGTEETSKTITKRNADTAYEVKVIASMADGSFQSLAAATAVSVRTKELSKISGIKATNVTDNSFVVSWNGVDQASKYWVYINGNLYDRTTDTSVNVTGRSAYTTYEIQVVASLENGSVQSLENATVVTVQTKAVARVSGVGASGVTDSSFTVYWSRVNGASKYWVYVNGSLYSGTEGTSKTIAGRKADTAYEIKVIASLENGTFQSLEDATAVTVQTTPVPKVTGVNAQDITDTSFVLTWDPFQGAAKYWVYINGQLYKSTTTSTIHIVGRKADTAYEIKVIASLENGTFQSLANATALTVQTGMAE